MKPCGCGCGELIAPRNKNGPVYFKPGHHVRLRRFPPACAGIYTRGNRFCSVCNEVRKPTELYCPNCHKKTRMKASNYKARSKVREQVYPMVRRY